MKTRRTIGVCVVAAAALLLMGCSSTGTRAGGGEAVPQVRVRATALRILGSEQAQKRLDAMTADNLRSATVVPYENENQFVEELRRVADVQVIGSPGVLLGVNGGTLHLSAPAATETSEYGFLSGVNTDVRLAFENIAAPRGMIGLRATGSFLQFTPDKNADSANSVKNAAYTRMRDFESDLKLRPGQPVVLSGPALIEQGDGLWTGVVVVLTPEVVSGSAVAEVADQQ